MQLYIQSAEVSYGRDRNVFEHRRTVSDGPKPGQQKNKQATSQRTYVFEGDGWNFHPTPGMSEGLHLFTYACILSVSRGRVAYKHRSRLR